MPRRIFRRKRYVRRRLRPRLSTLQAASYLAKKAYKGIRYIKGLVNSELYKFDNAYVGNAITDSGATYNLVTIAQGDGDSQRTGNSIFVRSINCKGYITRTTSGDPTQLINVSIVIDTQQVGDTLPSITDVYENATPYAHLNSNTVGRFKIIYSRSFTLDTVKTLSHLININIPMRHHVRYNGTGSGDFQRGGIFLFVRSTQATTNYPQLTMETRTSYHDN